MQKKLKVAVGMSGGVDSGVSAKLLVDAGYDVAGVHLHFWAEHDPKYSRENKCCSTESLMAARATCDMLGIPFYTFNFEDIFKETVVDYFIKEFKELRTPNPCVVCNRKIKTGRLVKYVQSLGFDMLATGHYIRLFEGNDNNVIDYTDVEKRRNLLNIYPNNNPLFLMSGKDVKKDQSYFLYTMKQEDLVHLIFPLGNMVKDDVRKMAVEFDLPVAKSKESFDICFIPGDNYRDFLQRHMPEYCIPGEVVNVQGEVIGEHQGLPFYAIGQRRGFTTRLPYPYFVINFDKEKNQLIVGSDGETKRSNFSLHTTNIVDEKSEFPLECSVRLRHMGGLYDAIIEKSDNNFSVKLTEPQRGISPGQSAVFFRNDVLLGGGVINQVIS